jgi:hypothetical protein
MDKVQGCIGSNYESASLMYLRALMMMTEARAIVDVFFFIRTRERQKPVWK